MILSEGHATDIGPALNANDPLMYNLEGSANLSNHVGERRDVDAPKTLLAHPTSAGPVEIGPDFNASISLDLLSESDLRSPIDIGALIDAGLPKPD